jgi:hypothetical protein
MTDTLSRILGPVAIPSGATTVFTGTIAHIYTVRNITIGNTSGSDIDLKLGINGLADADLFLPLTPVEAGGRAEFSGLLVLEGTDTLEADASGNGLTITISGLDQN